VDATSRKVLERAWGDKAGGAECQVMARLWYCSKELQPKGGFESGKHAFLPLSKGFKTWVLPGSSWVPVVAVQKSRVRVENDYRDNDDGILSLKRGVLATASGEEANGWAQVRALSQTLHVSAYARACSRPQEVCVCVLRYVWAQVRTDSGEEGWFPAGYIRLVRKYIELEDEEDKVLVAYSHLSSTKASGKNDHKTPPKGAGCASKHGRSAEVSSKKGSKEREKTAGEEGYSDTEEGKKEYSRRNRKITDRFSPTWEELVEQGLGGGDTGKRGRGASVGLVSDGSVVDGEYEVRSTLRDKLSKLGHTTRTPEPAEKTPSNKDNKVYMEIYTQIYM